MKSPSTAHSTGESSYHKNSKQRGAALLMAMLTVTLVATLAAASLWQQWRSVEVEAAERQRVQSGWILTGALDWARLILREDARSASSGTDHLAEPWAVALQESRLSTFLAADRDNTGGQASDEQLDAFLSGQITDMQSRLNLRNLVDNNQVSATTLAAWGRLFNLLNLPEQELVQLSTQLQLALDASKANSTATAIPLLPRSASQLAWLGLSPATVAALQPYVCVLPVRTPVNLNTASAAVLVASVPQLSMADAQKLVAARARQFFKSTADASAILNQPSIVFTDTEHTTFTRYFEVLGRLRLGGSTVLERSLVQRDGSNVTTQWRERTTEPLPTMPTP